MPKNGLTWDRNATPQQVFKNAVEQYAGQIQDAAYRIMVTEAPGVEDVLRNVGTWDDNKAEGGDYIQVRPYRGLAGGAGDDDRYNSGLLVYYDFETYRVMHPKEDPDFDWHAKHLAGRSMSEIKYDYDRQKQQYMEWLNAKTSVAAGVDDRTVETFYDEARYLWDMLVSRF